MRHLHYPHLRLAPPNDSPYGASPPPTPPSPPPADPGPGLPAQPGPPAGPQSSTGPQSSGTQSTGAAGANGGTAGPEALQDALQHALGPIQAELAQLRAENASLRDSQAPQAPSLSAGGSGDGDDFTQALLSDPKGAVTSVVKEVVGRLSPFFNELSGTAHEAILEGHRGAIDAEFGNGTFHEELMPILSKRFDTARRENPTLLASREWINSEVNAAKGFKMNSLIDRRGKAAEARTEAEKAEAERLLSRFNATNLTGGLRSGGDKPREPTPDEQAYLAAREKSGSPIDLETLRRSQSSGNNLASYLASLPKKES